MLWQFMPCTFVIYSKLTVILSFYTLHRERAEREAEANAKTENAQSDDDDVVFGNVSITIILY